MKRNRRRELNKKEALTKRTAVLLSEMEEASSRVLRDQFEFNDTQVEQFLKFTRLQFSQIAQPRPVIPAQRQELSLIAQRFGLAAMQVLTAVFGFDSESNDRWLKRLIEVGNEGRAAR